eukprot:5268595-Prymnesium_polylepis.2
MPSSPRRHRPSAARSQLVRLSVCPIAGSWPAPVRWGGRTQACWASVSPRPQRPAAGSAARPPRASPRPPPSAARPRQHSRQPSDARSPAPHPAQAHSTTQTQSSPQGPS